MARPKKLTLDFFIHDAAASRNPKIEALVSRHGNDGYAFYFRMLEALCEHPHVQLCLKEEWELECFAARFKLRDAHQLIEIVAYSVRLGLFNKQLWESERIVFSDSLYQRYKEKLEERIADAERKGKGKEYEDLSTHLQEFSARKTPEDPEGSKPKIRGQDPPKNSFPPGKPNFPSGKPNFPPGKYTDQDQDLEDQEKIPPTPQSFEERAEDAPKGAGEFFVDQLEERKRPHLQKLELPKELDFPEFRESLSDWRKHCEEHGLEIMPTQFKKLIEKFKAWGSRKSIKLIDHSIASGYKGVIEPIVNVQTGKGEAPPLPMFPPVPKDQFVKPSVSAVNSALRAGLQQVQAGHLAGKVRFGP